MAVATDQTLEARNLLVFRKMVTTVELSECSQYLFLHSKNSNSDLF